MKKTGTLIVLLLATFLLKAQDDIITEDLFSGTANINIPIITKSVDGVDIGVSINYNTKGITSFDKSSIVGIGWAINKGATITRQVKGLPDEFCFLNAGRYLNIGYWHRLNNNITVEPNFISTIDNISTQKAISHGYVDGQMDIFNTTINGVNIEFMFNCNDEIIVQPLKSNCKIERTIDGIVVNTFPKNIHNKEIGFKITDWLGNIYIFKSGDKIRTDIKTSEGTPLIPTPAQVASGNIDRCIYANNWVVEKIITYNGNEINYEYSDLGVADYFGEPYVVSNSIGTYQEFYPDINISDFVNFTTGNSNDMVKELFLKKIKFGEEQIIFTYRDENIGTSFRCDRRYEKALHEITLIENNNFNTVYNNQYYNPKSKKIRFDQTYTGETVPYHSCSGLPGNGGIGAAAMKLNKISYVNPNNTLRHLFQFDYYSLTDLQNLYGGVLNQYITGEGSDYWGFPNGNATPSLNFTYPEGMYVPSDLTNPTSEGSNRTPNMLSALNNLKTIENEKGGITEFEYENNQAIVNSVNMLLDGVRIKKATTYTKGLTDNTTIHQSTFQYENGEWLIPHSTTYPNIIDLFKIKKTIERYPEYPLNGTPAPSVHIPDYTATNIDVLSSSFIGQSDRFQHGYGKVIKTKSKISKVKLQTGQIGSRNDLIETEEKYFTTLNNIPTSNFSFNGTSATSEPYNIINSNISNPIPFSTSSLFSIQATDYFKTYNSFPYTSKKYYPNWVIGIPFKSIKRDNNGNIITESEQQYEINVHALNTDNNINLNASLTKFKFRTNSGAMGKTDVFEKDYYYPIVGNIIFKKNNIKTYTNPLNYLSKNIEYQYDNQTDNLKSTIETNSNNVKTEFINYYNNDNSHWGNNPEMNNLTTKNRNQLIYSETWREEIGKPKVLINASGGGYNVIDNKTIRTKSYSLIGNNLLQISPVISGNYNLVNLNNGNTIPNFIKTDEITQVDKKGNVNEVRSRDGKYHSTLYNVYSNIKSATISNARFNEVAYTSFESNFIENDNSNYNYQIDKGNWIYNGNKISFWSSITGTKSYSFSVGNNTINTNSNVQLQVGKKYTISYWVKKLCSNTNIEIKNIDLASPSTAISIPMNEIYTNTSPILNLNNWKLIQSTFTALYPSISIEGYASTNYCSSYSYPILIDEIKLYPADAVMNAVITNPIIGKIAEISPSNQIVLFENDENSSTNIVRDIQGNILSKSKSVSQQND